MSLLRKHESNYIRRNTGRVRRFGPTNPVSGEHMHWVDTQDDLQKLRSEIQLGSGTQMQPDENYIEPPERGVQHPIYEIAPTT